MAYINLTNISISNSTLDIFKAVNVDMTNGFFMLLAIISLFIILLINYTVGSFKEGFLMSSFIIAVLSGFLWLAGLVPFVILVATFILVMFAVIIMFIT